MCVSFVVCEDQSVLILTKHVVCSLMTTRRHGIDVLKLKLLVKLLVIILCFLKHIDSDILKRVHDLDETIVKILPFLVKLPLFLLLDWVNQ